MKIEIAKKWVRALRSGKYKQGTGVLEHVDNKGKSSFCCLGVLCKITKAPRKVQSIAAVPVPYKEVLYGNFNKNDDDDSTVLPISVKKKVGMHSVEGKLRLGPGKSKATDLTILNDDKKYTFDEIADCIDAMIYGGIINEL